MSRDVGGVDLVQGSIPEWLAVVVALLTQLGDVWFLAVLYWVDAPTREDVAALAGVALTGMGLYSGLKVLFGLPRPESPLIDSSLLPRLVRPLYEATATAGGYGFPSGHAVNATIVYLGLASVATVWTPRRRYAVAAAIVAIVCLSRVALGVHYLVDVVAGAAIGLAVLLVARVLLERGFADRATIAFALGIGAAAFYLVASDWTGDAMILLATALGGFGGWQIVMLGRRLAVVRSASQAVSPILVRGGAAAVAATPLVAALIGSLPVALTTVAGLVGLGMAAAVVLPVLRHSAYARAVFPTRRGS